VIDTDLYVSGESWLHCADPRLKFLVLALGTVLLFTYSNLALMAISLACLQVMLLTARIPWARIKTIWALMLPVAILIPVLWPIFYQAGPTWATLWHIRITAWAVAQGLTTATRILSLAFLFSSLLLTTQMRSVLRALVRLGLPFESALTMTIALSYIPRIQRTYQQVTEAQLARGMVLGQGDFITRARARIPILVAALVSTFRSADTTARALEARGFGYRAVPRTSLFEVYWRPTDTILAIATALAFGLALFARFVLGVGAHPVYLW